MSEWTKWQETHEHIRRRLSEACPFCKSKTADLWWKPDPEFYEPFQVRCATCGASGPECDCGEESAVPMWLSVQPLPDPPNTEGTGT